LSVANGRFTLSPRPVLERVTGSSVRYILKSITCPIGNASSAERERAAQWERRKWEQERVEKKKQEAESFWGMKKAKKH